MEDEHLLIDALIRMVGKSNIYVCMRQFPARPHLASLITLIQIFSREKEALSVDTLEEQIHIFREAQIVMGSFVVNQQCTSVLITTGPHGAGLTNLIFAPRNASVIEFAMKPHCNRCFGYMAAALDMDYWLVPQLHATYRTSYTLDPGKIAAVLRVVAHVLELKGLGHIMTRRDEL